MELLGELVTLYEETILEDLGNLKQLGAGRMLNALKQTYGTSKHGIYASDIGNKINIYSSGIGAGSEIIDAGIISNWAAIKKAYKANATKYPRTCVLYAGSKSIALLTCGLEDLSHSSYVIGVAWDFSGLGLTDDEIGLITSKLGWGQSVDKIKSARSKETTKGGWGSNPERIEVKHYQGIAQRMAAVKPFVESIFATVKSQITMKLITLDSEGQNKRGDRNKNNSSIDGAATLFVDDLKTRLAKYKNTKVQSVDDLQSFIAKVFEGGLKKIKFKGLTYEAIPEEKVLGSNDSKRISKKYEIYSDKTMRDLFSGKEINVQFNSDRAANEYYTMYVSFKFKNGQLIPTKARWFDNIEKKYIDQSV